MPERSTTRYGTAAGRWAGLGPYYAMFPTEFADRVIRDHSSRGDLVLDPFAGRGTGIFSAASHGRTAIGIEISPVGFVYSKTKLRPAELDAVADRLTGLGKSAASRRYTKLASELPPFFRKCFAPGVRRFLVAAREELEWRRSTIDRTTMAIVLVYLHGKEGAALSNQMRQTKSMAPDYSIRWWVDNGYSPPRVDPVDFLLARLEWRYAKGIPECEPSNMYFGSSLSVLPRLHASFRDQARHRAKLLFTSPPYCGVTDYHYDQWLRLWLLGGPPEAARNGDPARGRFENKVSYENLLAQVFALSKPLLHRDATIYVRTDARKFTRDTTIAVLQRLFPHKSLSVRRRPVTRETQTHLFGDFGKRAGEVDVLLTPR